MARDEAMCLSLARQFVHGKIRNHRTLLMRNHLEPPEAIIGKLKRASDDALTAASIEELLGIEGAAASQYFQQFNGMAHGRKRPLDPGREIAHHGLIDGQLPVGAKLDDQRPKQRIVGR